MITTSTRNKLGWAAVLSNTGLACFWAFWGTLENFHEGWYFPSLKANLSLMLLQYLPWGVGFAAMGLVALRWPRWGALLLALVGILLPVLWIQSTAALAFIGVPMLACQRSSMLADHSQCLGPGVLPGFYPYFVTWYFPLNP
ncbi:MAG: hypothetical protein IPL65_10830 [Lewinellaceae bacterium]|nr:hypothetical protein [Lewinellaceae bacterium]